MAVYVDWLMHHGAQSGFFKGKKSCHMFADTLEELHDMAEKIGMKRSWFQDNGQSAEHYDLVESRRKLAIQHGAKELTSREQVCYFIDLSRKRRGQGTLCEDIAENPEAVSEQTLAIDNAS